MHLPPSATEAPPPPAPQLWSDYLQPNPHSHDPAAPPPGGPQWPLEICLQQLEEVSERENLRVTAWQFALLLPGESLHELVMRHGESCPGPHQEVRIVAADIPCQTVASLAITFISTPPTASLPLHCSGLAPYPSTSLQATLKYVASQTLAQRHMTSTEAYIQAATRTSASTSSGRSGRWAMWAGVVGGPWWWVDHGGRAGRMGLQLSRVPNFRDPPQSTLCALSASPPEEPDGRKLRLGRHSGSPVCMERWGVGSVRWIVWVRVPDLRPPPYTLSQI